MNYSFNEKSEHPLTKRGDHHQPAAGSGSSQTPAKRETSPGQPAWAKGLQRLYDEVVEEQLPDDFAKLLDQLDRAADGN